MFCWPQVAVLLKQGSGSTSLDSVTAHVCICMDSVTAGAAWLRLQLRTCRCAEACTAPNFRLVLGLAAGGREEDKKIRNAGVRGPRSIVIVFLGQLE